MLALIDTDLFDKSSLVFLWQIWLAPGIIVTLCYVTKLALNNNQEARTLIAGLAIFSVTVVSDALVVNGVTELPRLAPLGFLFVVIGMVFSLSNRFILSHVNLEHAVKERTHELQKMNVLRRIIAPMGTMDAIEFINSKLKNTKNNAEFFDSMNKPS